MVCDWAKVGAEVGSRTEDPTDGPCHPPPPDLLLLSLVSSLCYKRTSSPPHFKRRFIPSSGSASCFKIQVHFKGKGGPTWSALNLDQLDSGYAIHLRRQIPIKY